MGIDSITIKRDKRVYYAGEPITGHLVVVVSNPVEQTDSIELKFEGNANVEWSETRTRQIRDDSTGETKSESYLEFYRSSQTIILLRRDLAVKGGFLNVGTNLLPFSLETPYHLPSSFEGQHGSVRYSMTVNKRDLGFFESFYSYAQSTKPIKILQPIDTNAPMYSFPVGGEDSKTVCCCCCKSGPLSIITSTDRAAFCPGETVGVTATFENQSNREATPYARLIMHEKYYAQGGSNYVTKSWDLKPVNDDGTEHTISEGGSCEWNNILFPIPPCYSSMKCEIIDIYFTVEVSLNISMALDLRVSLPIVIGTIPYRGPQVVTRQIMGATAPPLPGWSGVGLQISPQIRPTAPPIAMADERVHFDEPPPSYFETMFANNNNNQGDEDNETGVPRRRH